MLFAWDRRLFLCSHIYASLFPGTARDEREEGGGVKVQATPPEWGPRPSCGGVNVFAYELGRCGGACGDSPREAGKMWAGKKKTGSVGSVKNSTLV